MKEFKNMKAEIKKLESLISTTGGCSGCFSQGGIWGSNESR